MTKKSNVTNDRIILVEATGYNTNNEKVTITAIMTEFVFNNFLWKKGTKYICLDNKSLDAFEKPLLNALMSNAHRGLYVIS